MVKEMANPLNGTINEAPDGTIEDTKDGQKGTKMKPHVEEEGLFLDMHEMLGQHEVTRTADGKKFRDSLKDSEEKGGKGCHEIDSFERVSSHVS